MNRFQYDVVALGELLIDFTMLEAQPDGYPVMAAHPGGAPANLLAMLAALGRKTAYIAKVGDDAFGRRLVDTMKELGVETKGIVVTPEAFTTLAFVTLGADGAREFSFARKPGADTLLSEKEVDYSLIDDARAFHFGTLSVTDDPARTATFRALMTAKKQGKLISYDPNYRAPLWDTEFRAQASLRWGLAQTEVVKISDEEIKFLFKGLPAEKGAARLLHDFPLQLVYVTCGSEGAYGLSRSMYEAGEEQVFVPAMKLDAVDTTGAGDLFGGAALHKLLEILGDERRADSVNAAELTEILRFANAAAGLSTLKQGGVSSVPSLEEIDKALKTLYN